MTTVDEAREALLNAVELVDDDQKKDVLAALDTYTSAVREQKLRDAAVGLLTGSWPDGFFKGVAGAAREITARADGRHEEGQ